MESHWPPGMSYRDFLDLPEVSDLDDQVDELGRQVQAAQQAQTIRDRPGFEFIEVPSLPAGFAELLSRTIDDVGDAAERTTFNGTLPTGFDPSSNDYLLSVSEFLREQHDVGGSIAEFGVDGNDGTISYKAAGYAADAFFDTSTGEYQLVVEQQGEFRFMLFAQAMTVLLHIQHQPLRLAEAKAVRFDLGMFKRRAIDVFEGRYELAPLSTRRAAPRTQLRYTALIGLRLPPPPAIGNVAVRQNQSAPPRADLSRAQCPRWFDSHLLGLYQSKRGAGTPGCYRGRARVAFLRCGWPGGWGWGHPGWGRVGGGWIGVTGAGCTGRG